MRIHLTGIGGVGMAGLAFLLKSRGHEVDGCDLKPTPRTKWLESVGIPVAIGHDAKHVEGKELVIVTPAVAKDNPEYVASESRRKCRGEMLAEIVNAAPDSIAVCGSHGKTTTSTFIAKLLIELGESVEWAIGGETGVFPVAGVRSSDSTSSVLVVEADESDGTLALYHAKTLVVTNCEYDHPDHFKTKEDYFACYDRARANAGKVIEGSGLGAGSREQLRIFQDFDKSATDHCSLITDHCLGDPNAMLAVRVALSRGHSLEAIAAVLPRVMSELPDRRFQRIQIPPATFNLDFRPLVYTDYGHHPTEVRYSISRARALLDLDTANSGAQGLPVLRVLFQPHRYSRTAAFLKEFATALRGADEVVLCPVYSAFEKPIPHGTSADLYAVMREQVVKEEGEQRRVKLFLARSCEEAWEHACNSMKPGDLTLIQGAGDILEKVRKRIAAGREAVHRIWIGAGTNTVKTDLNLSVEYVKTTGPAAQIGVAHPLLGALFPWMAGIPGTLGGWVKMNAGAHGHSISEVIESVKVDGRWIPASECGFSYRHSDIEGEIQDVRWKEVKEKGDVEQWNPSFFLEKRKMFPAHTRGSVFKNPEGDFAGRLLEESGCRGLRVGGAYVWEEHANVIVAPPGEATASDFLALSQIMCNRVYFRFGITLIPEVRGI